MCSCWMAPAAVMFVEQEVSAPHELEKVCALFLGVDVKLAAGWESVS